MKKFRSKKASKEAKRRLRRLLWLAAILPILIIVAIATITRLETFRINEVVIEGVETIDQNQIKKAINLQLDDTQLLLISNQTPLTFPKSKTENSILESNPALDTVEIMIEKNTVTVTVVEKLPYAAICTEQDYILEKCQVIDESGELFSEYTLELQAKGKIPIIVKNPTLLLADATASEEISYPDDSSKSAILNDEVFSFLKEIIILYAQENINPFEYIVVSPDATIDLYYSKDSFVRFMAKRSLSIQIEALETSFAKMSEIAQVLQEYQYVDVRFEDRVYFKKKEDKSVEPEKSNEIEEVEEIEEVDTTEDAEQSTVQNQ